jgi:hypothetical protein
VIFRSILDWLTLKHVSELALSERRMRGFIGNRNVEGHIRGNAEEEYIEACDLKNAIL